MTRGVPTTHIPRYRPCAYCETTLDASLSYTGSLAANPCRTYCRPACSRAAFNARRRARWAWAKRNGGLAQMHALEAAGQLTTVPEALPALEPQP